MLATETKAEENMTAKSTTAPALLLGQNSRGAWIVRDHSSLRGGLFVSRADAMRYVRLETGHRRPAIKQVSGTLELDLSSPY